MSTAALAALTAGFVGLGAVERWSHRRHLHRIPERLHVAGTRGKSSVTRLLAAGLRGGGLTTVAKTTGTLARVLLPDGREVPLFRPAGANMIEQKRVVRAAAELGADALVLECMALQPRYHWLSERQLVRATRAIITNARADHLDVMGPTVRDVAACLASIVPPNGIVYTAENTHLDVFQAACADRNATLIHVGPDDVASIGTKALLGFPYTEHAENLALALRVLDDLGIDRQTALQEMWRQSPDPGAMLTYDMAFFGRHLRFVNAFAANDVQSTQTVWAMARAASPIKRTLALINVRADRPHRTAQLAREATFWLEADAVIAMGSGRDQFARLASRIAGAPPVHLSVSDEPSALFEDVLTLSTGDTLIVGVGNIGGPGLAFVRHFANRSRVAMPHEHTREAQ